MYLRKIQEIEETLARNVSEIACIVDGIRNPLTAILLTGQVERNIYEKVKAQVERITNLLDTLDYRWGESENLGALKNLKKGCESPARLGNLNYSFIKKHVQMRELQLPVVYIHKCVFGNIYLTDAFM